MISRFLRVLRSRFNKRGFEVAPDEIFIDSHNLPQYDTYQMEGKLERPLPRRLVLVLSLVFLGVGIIYAGQVFRLQFIRGEVYAERSEENRLAQISVFADRGVIQDRNGVPLAWNTPNPQTSEFSLRTYATTTGIAHVVGYVTYPKKDTSGVYYQTTYEGKVGAEKRYGEELSGENGIKIIEMDALGNIISENTLEDPIVGDDVELTISARLQSEMYEHIKQTAEDYSYRGGAGVIMNLENGEILVLTSYPEFDPHVMTDGNADNIEKFLSNENTPFLNRVLAGQFTPGSTVKPYVAAAALEEGVIDPDKTIVSTGQITVPNPYFEDKESVFRDWKAHGPVDMRDAIAVSSNVYFYVVGGGYKDQDGLGISKIAEYMHRFGLGEPTGLEFAQEAEGVVPTPEWKANHFEDDQWRLGDTYHTSIGQYGFQVTPLQALRAIGSIANRGELITPRLIRQNRSHETKSVFVGVDDAHLQVVREGMRRAVTDGYVRGLDMPDLKVAAKTGTAEVGVDRSLINSWVVGFFPYEEPKYAFAVVMERGPSENNVGGVKVMRGWFDAVRDDHPEFYPSYGE